MLMRPTHLITVTLAAAAVAAACGGSGGDKTPTTQPASTSVTALKTATTLGTAAASTPTAVASPIANKTPRASFDLDSARALLNSALLQPADLDGTWTIGTDTVQDNAAAVAADPKSSASVERCGRLLSRLVVNQPDNLVERYISGQTVSFFSTATVYETAAGAEDCAAEAAQRLAQPGQLARAFGSVFKDPDAVVVTPVTYPPVGDSSAAFNLAGQVDASGTVVDLTILVVSFRKGNVTAVVASANSAAPPVDELTPLVNKVLQRITDAQ